MDVGDMKEINKEYDRICGRQVVRPVSAGLKPYQQNILDECYVMLGKLRRNPELRKVYSDVNFHRIIDELEGYREDLETAQALFGDGGAGCGSKQKR